MNARTVAGWVAAGAGLILLLGMAGIATSTGLIDDAGPTSWTMGPGMMGFGASGPASTAIPSAPEVRLQAANFSFTPTEIRLPRNAEVNLTLANPAASGVVHDLTVPVLGIRLVAEAGATQTLGLRSLPAGRYDAYCSVPGHAASGMRATVIVE